MKRFSVWDDGGRGEMKHILLVDDDASHRMSLRDLLEAEGFLCEESEDGEEAEEKLVSDSFDLVITDLNMPGVNGFDLLMAMAESDMLETTPVMVITGNLNEDIRKDVLGFGAAAVLFKPYQPTDLLSIVAKTIRNSPQAMQIG